MLSKRSIEPLRGSELEKSALLKRFASTCIWRRAAGVDSEGKARHHNQRAPAFASRVSSDDKMPSNIPEPYHRNYTWDSIVFGDGG